MSVRLFISSESPETVTRAIAPHLPALDARVTESRADADLVISDGEVEPAGGPVTIRLDGGDGSRDDDVLAIERELFLASPGSLLRWAVDRVTLRRELARAIDQLRLSETVLNLLVLPDQQAVYQEVTATVRRIAGASFGTLLMHDAGAERFATVYSDDEEHRDETGEFIPGVSREAVEDSLRGEETWGIDERDARSVVLPIRHDGDLIGLVKLRMESDPETESLERAAGYLGSIGSILTNVHQLGGSNDLVMRDDLTRAYNRRFFESYLDEEITRARRYQMVFSIIFLDLDDLKSVNNAHGHLAGSRTLQEVAKRILGAVRTIDKVVRFGGDEFCIILPQTHPEQAKSVAERVRRAIGRTPLRLATEVEVAITASFGIAAFPQHASTKDELIHQADAAMYAVKSRSKNGIGVAGEGLPSAIRGGGD